MPSYFGIVNRVGQKLSVPGFWNSWNESMVNHVFSLDERKEEVSELDKYSYWCSKKWFHRRSTDQSRGWCVWLPSSPKAQSTLNTRHGSENCSPDPLITNQKTTLKAENYHSTEMISSPDMNGHGSILCKTQPVTGLKFNLILQYRLSTGLFQVFHAGAW